MASTAAALLEVRSISKRFGGLTAVANVDLDVAAGEILGVIGPNGAGKTTLFNMIAGALPATGGTVQFSGVSILGRAPHEIAALGLIRTFQHNRPFTGMSLVENVLVGAHTRFKSGLLSIAGGTRAAREEEARQRARADELVAFVGLADVHDTEVDNLSFGQGRLLEIARAMAGQPRLILLDEPAAGLTPAELDRLATILRGGAAQGIAVLLIEHDMRFLLPLAHRIVVLNFGAVIATGTPDAIRVDPAVRDAYLGQPASHAAT
ncbi:MAG: ABC transporter ATP-binding protein [Betaproteobacteria bacterium]|nr:ABC transporter ATP-binding protein [Betaproteobacteria bacterium]